MGVKILRAWIETWVRKSKMGRLRAPYEEGILEIEGKLHWTY
jgi:hypothetical protein